MKVLARYCVFAVALLTILTGCQLNNPPQPTIIPVASSTATTSPPPTSSPGPTITLRPLIEFSTVPPTNNVIAEVPTVASTPNAYCFAAKANDTVCGLIFAAGYPVCSSALSDAFRQANNMAPGSTNIQPGQNYCVPRPTPTITPPHYEETQTQQAPLLQTLRLSDQSKSLATYVIKPNDTITTIELNTGMSLRVLCDLNGPNPLNCAGCALDKPVGEHGCRPIVAVGVSLKIPGPTATPTTTPTISGSETATPTPPYGAPRLVAPVNGASLAGSVQLVWLPVGTILQNDEFYLILITDSTTSRTWELETQATSLRLPSDVQPNDLNTHTFNWRVVVAHKGVDGSYILVGQKSLIFTFTWG